MAIETTSVYGLVRIRNSLPWPGTVKGSTPCTVKTGSSLRAAVRSDWLPPPP
jgi:hypothetical protein